MRRLLLPLAGLAALVAVPSFAATLALGDSDNDGVTDNLDGFPCDSARTSMLAIPAEGQRALLMFEDQWPAQGDLDFNDALVSYNERIFARPASGGQTARFEMSVQVLAAGGTFRNGLAIHLPLPSNAASSITITENGNTRTVTPEAGESELVIRLYDDMRTAFTSGAADTVINADPALPARSSNTIELAVDFNTGHTLSSAQAPFDVFIFRSADYSHQIHLPQFAGTTRMNAALFNTQNDGSNASRHFVDTRGLPFALNIPADVPHAVEGRDIALLYPDILTFASSGGTQQTDFFNRPVAQHRFTVGSNAQGRPTFAAVPNNTAVTTCVTPRRFSGLRLWLDANDNSTIDTNAQGVVTVWNSKTPDSNQMTILGNPTRVSNVINGKPAIRFDGVDDWTRSNTSSTLIRERTMFVVAKLSTLNPTGSAVGGGALTVETSGVDQFDSIVYNERIARRWMNGSTGFQRTPGTEGSFDETTLTAHILTNRQFTGNFTLFRDGQNISTSLAYSPTSIGVARFVVGNRHTVSGNGVTPVANGFFSGDIAEAIVYDRALNDTERAQVEAYLAAKWGVTLVQ